MLKLLTFEKPYKAEKESKFNSDLVNLFELIKCNCKKFMLNTSKGFLTGEPTFLHW